MVIVLLYFGNAMMFMLLLHMAANVVFGLFFMTMLNFELCRTFNLSNCMQVVITTFYCMTFIVRATHRLLSTMTDSYLAGSHSVAFVTVPNIDVGKQLAKYINRLFMMKLLDNLIITFQSPYISSKACVLHIDIWL